MLKYIPSDLYEQDDILMDQQVSEDCLSETGNRVTPRVLARHPTCRSPYHAAIVLRGNNVMDDYTFLSANGEYVTVYANDEMEARRLAMVKLWGPIQYQPEWLGKDWVGFGLMLKGEA